MGIYTAKVTRMVPETVEFEVEGEDEFEAYDRAWDHAFDVLHWGHTELTVEVSEEGQ